MEAIGTVGWVQVRRLVQAQGSEVAAMVAMAVNLNGTPQAPRVRATTDTSTLEASIRLRSTIGDTEGSFVAVFGGGAESVGGYCIWTVAPVKILDRQVSAELTELALAASFVASPAAVVALLERASQLVIGWLRSLSACRGIGTYQLEVWVEAHDTAAQAWLAQVFTGGQCGFRELVTSQVMLVRREVAPG